MKKTKLIIAVMLMFVITRANIMASEQIESGVLELNLEDAIKKAQAKDSAIQNQSKNIQYAEYDKQDAKNKYDNNWDTPPGDPRSPEQFSVNYYMKISRAKYEKDIVPVLEDQVANEVSNLFDEILDKEEQLDLANEALKLQKTKLSYQIRRETLGVASRNSVRKENAALLAKKQEVNTLEVSIASEYRKLNDKISGESPRYKLIKPLEYKPLEMGRSMPGQINHAINSDLNIRLQEESAKDQERLLVSRGEDGYAPTYSEYQKRKIAYEQGLDKVKESKGMKEEQVKAIYENIKALEAQRLQVEVELEEAIRQSEILKVQKELGFVTQIQTKDAELAVKQLKYELNNMTRNHNKLKEFFEKPHLQAGQMQAQ